MSKQLIPLLKDVTDAHGGLDRWRRFQGVTAHQSAFSTRLPLFNRVERFQDQIKLTRAAAAGFEVFAHAHQHSLDRRAVDNSLRVLVQLVKAFRAGHFRLARLLNLLEQPVNLFRR